MKAQSADKMKEVVTEIVTKMCPSFAWADGEVLVVGNYPYDNLYIECLEDTVSVGFYQRVYVESLPNPVYTFFISDWTLRGYENMDGEKYQWWHDDLEGGRFSKTFYGNVLIKSEIFAYILHTQHYASGKVKKHHRL